MRGGRGKKGGGGGGGEGLRGNSSQDKAQGRISRMSEDELVRHDCAEGGLVPKRERGPMGGKEVETSRV